MREWLKKVWKRIYVTTRNLKVLLYLKLYRKGYGFYRKPYNKGKGIRKRKNLFFFYPVDHLVVLYYNENIYFAK